jgi:host factor-I protein
MTKQANTAINVQDPFFYQLRKEAKTIYVYLISGKRLTGIIRRFDKYALVLECHGQEQLVYKHAIANIAATTNYSEPNEGKP